MELLNATGMQAGYTMGMKPDGRELLVVVVKGTFAIPKNGEEPQLLAQQIPIVEADSFTGEPGLSAPVYESDYSPFKAQCDVLFLGSAYAPGGMPTDRVRVSLHCGQVQKQFDVVGNRNWSGGFWGAGATEPDLFTVQPISYDVAAGGVDNLEEDPAKHEAHPVNPIGRGFFPKSSARLLDGKPLPNTEEPGRRIENPQQAYVPMGFGPIGRSWQPRVKFAGTYDQNWIDDTFPFLPEDFDERYYQCAPEDQQTPYLQGGESVRLIHMTPEGDTSFYLPRVEVPVTFYYRNYEEKELIAVADTLVIEPDLERFTIAWRIAVLLRKNMFEVAQVVAGRMPRAWYRARELGKTYYPSLKALVDSRKAERIDVFEHEIAEAEEAADGPEETEDTPEVSKS